MVFSFFKSQLEQREDTLGCQDAFRLWNMNNQRFFMINQLMHVANFTHDLEFKHLINQYIQHFQSEVRMFEKELERYSLPSPTPSMAGVNVKGNFEIEKDIDTAALLFNFLQINCCELIQSLRSSTINDHIRSIFYKVTKDCFNRLDSYIKYLKLKGWIECPPLYPYVQDYVDDQIATNEIYHLWDHLFFRYTNVHQTEIFLKFVTDQDLKTILATGCNVLVKQTRAIENLLLKFGVTLPTKYPEVSITPPSKEIIEDRYIFNTIFLGIQNASILHSVAIRESLVNDDVRRFFINLLFEEIDLINKFIKYGKLKGWLVTPPTYRAP